jgi:hypothetical protein
LGFPLFGTTQQAVVAITDFLDQAINDLETEVFYRGFHPLTFGTRTSVPFLFSVYTGALFSLVSFLLTRTTPSKICNFSAIELANQYEKF